jgi:hypothetical protein
MSGGIHPWTNYERSCLVKLMKESGMQKLFHDAEVNFMEVVKEEINIKVEERYPEYIRLDMNATRNLVNTYLEEMRYFHRIEDPVLAPLFARSLPYSCSFHFDC